MQIALTGASSTGKTTLLNDLLMTPMFKTHGIVSVQLDVRKIIDSMGIRADGIGADDHQLRQFQWVLLEEKNRQENFHDSYITDRSTVDMAAYWIVRDAKDTLDSEGEKYLENATTLHQNMIYIFICHLARSNSSVTGKGPKTRVTIKKLVRP